MADFDFMANFDFKTKEGCDAYIKNLLFKLNYWDGSEFEKPERCKDYLSVLFNALITGDSACGELANDLLHEKALRLMEKFPETASKKYRHNKTRGAEIWCPVGERYVTIGDSRFLAYPPLWWFVETNAAHDLIVKVHNLFPEAASFWGGVCFHTACRNRSLGNETLLFLLQKYPEALTSKNYGPVPVIQDIICGGQNIGGKFPFATIKAFMDVNPAVHGALLGRRRYPCYPLALALQIEGINPMLLRYLSENFPKSIDRFQLRADPNLATRALGGAFSSSQSKVLVSLLPQLKQLIFDPSNTMREGLTCLLGALPSQMKLETLHLSLRRNIIDDGILRVLETSLSKNTSISSLHVTLPSVDVNTPQEDDGLLEAISAGAREMRQLEDCHLTGFGISQNHTLVSFIANGAAPSSFCVDGFLFSDDSWPAKPDWYQACRVETLGMVNTRMKDGPLRHLWEQIPCLPLLQSVAIFNSTSLERSLNTLHSPIDLTAPLVRMLREQKLCRLDVSGGCSSSAFTANIEVLCEELRTNKSLKTFAFDAALNEDWHKACLAGTLAESNDTLELVTMTSDSRNAFWDEIQYWTRLNVAGRQKARDPSLSRRNFVELLCGAEIQEEDSVSIRYGLLRELPSRWSTVPNDLDEGSEAIGMTTKSNKRKGSSGKKRKRVD